MRSIFSQIALLLLFGQAVAAQADVQGCPHSGDVSAIAPRSISRDSSVELSRSGCFGVCPVYSVKISADGTVEWNGEFFVRTRGHRTSHISSDSAKHLLGKFLAADFWNLCNDYSAAITDQATTITVFRTGGRSKKVDNYANSAPAWFISLELEIDATANTHRWRHGDPRSEPLSNIDEDAEMPKPGVTPLMRAAALGNETQITAILNEKPDIDAVDSSGWTALMYAATSRAESDPVLLLLSAHANPNHRSARGDTPLMAAAISGLFDEDLGEAGADVNAMNSDGVTALMILAAKGEPDEVKEILESHADPSLKDKRGQTALSYLRLANCGKNPLHIETQYDPSSDCDNLDADDVAQISKLLSSSLGKKRAN